MKRCAISRPLTPKKGAKPKWSLPDEPVEPLSVSREPRELRGPAFKRNLRCRAKPFIQQGPSPLLKITSEQNSMGCRVRRPLCPTASGEHARVLSGQHLSIRRRPSSEISPQFERDGCRQRKNVSQPCHYDIGDNGVSASMSHCSPALPRRHRQIAQSWHSLFAWRGCVK